MSAPVTVEGSSHHGPDRRDDGPHPVCLHEDRWEHIQRDIADIKEIVIETHGKIFVGNGSPALVVRIDRMERVVNAIVWVLGGLVMAGLIAGLGTIFQHIFRGTP
jgi:hypothetical protein